MAIETRPQSDSVPPCWGIVLHQTPPISNLGQRRVWSEAAGAGNGLGCSAESIPLAASEAGCLTLASSVLSQSYLSQAVLARRNGNYVAVKVK